MRSPRRCAWRTASARDAPAEASINDKWLPDVDISYFFSPNVAAEMVLTYAQKHDLTVNGGKVGTFKVDPLLSGLGVGKRF